MMKGSTTMRSSSFGGAMTLPPASTLSSSPSPSLSSDRASSTSSPPPTSSHHQHSVPLHDIEDPTENDVLSGRGVTTNKHPGNVNFRSLVSLNKELYVTSTKKQKMSISRSIVEAVRSMNPPGRFLDKDPVTGLWSDIGDRKAIEKTSQALRDGAANLRKQLSEDLGDPDFISAVFEVDNNANTTTSTSNSASASLKDKNKPTKTKSVVKKGHRRTKSNPNTMQEKKKVLVVKKQNGPRGEEILVAEQRTHRHRQHSSSSMSGHPVSPTTTMSPFRSLSGSPLVHRPTLGRAASFEYARRRSYQVAAAASRNSTPSPSQSSPHQMHHPGAAAAAAAYHYHQQQQQQQQQQQRQSHGGEPRGYPSKGAGQSYESWMGYPSGHPYYRSPAPPPPGHPPLTQQHPSSSGYRSPTGVVAADVRHSFSPVPQHGGVHRQHPSALSPPPNHHQDRRHHHEAALSPPSQDHRQQHHVVLSPNQAAHYHAGYYQQQHASPHHGQQYPSHPGAPSQQQQQHYHRPPVSPSMHRPWSPRSFAAAANVSSPPPPPSHAQAQHAASWHHGQQRPSPTAYPAYSNGGDLNVPNLNTSRPGGGGAYHPSPNTAMSYHRTSSRSGGTASPNEDSMPPRVIRSASAEDFAPPISPTSSSSWGRPYPPERRTMSPREIPDRREEDEEQEASPKRTTTTTSGGGGFAGGASNNNKPTRPETMSTGSLSKSSSSSDSSMSSATKSKKLSKSGSSNNTKDHHSGYRSPTIVVSDAVGEDEKMNTESPGKSDIEVIYREDRDGEDTFMCDIHGGGYGGNDEERTSSHTRAGPAVDEDEEDNSSDISVDDSLAPLPFEPEEPERAASPHIRGCQLTRHFLDMIPESLLQMPIAPCGPQDED